MHKAPTDNIIALATPPGEGALAVFRLSGPDVIEITGRFFRPAGNKPLTGTPSHRLVYGELFDGDEIIDEVLISVFRAPRSYTGENVIEISAHGSPYIRRRILELFLQNGLRMARPGEFTLRAFAHGKMDLTRAEAVADLIAAETRIQHQSALHQLRGGFVRDIRQLRDQLLEFTALMELELDFAEEDVEFADRRKFRELLARIKERIQSLADSFAEGNVIKKGVAVSIVGEPNTGKSTLLNALLNEEKAIVTDIPGTTRDAIEDRIHIDGILFRFIDTAGIRHTGDRVEKLGIARTFRKMDEAHLILWLIDAAQPEGTADDVLTYLAEIRKKHPEKPVWLILNKIDTVSPTRLAALQKELEESTGLTVIPLSAKHGLGLDRLKSELAGHFRPQRLQQGQTVVTNARHHAALRRALQSLADVESGLEQGLSADLLAVDLRETLRHLGEITGEITTDDLLGHIFQNFCIGK